MRTTSIGKRRKNNILRIYAAGSWATTRVAPTMGQFNVGAGLVPALAFEMRKS